MSEGTLTPQVEALLLGSLAAPPDQRDEYLNQATDDPEVRATVRELLDAHGRGERRLRRLAQRLGAGEAMWSAGPQSAGPYRLIRELGRGGMSVVYLGQRDDGLFEHQVAVKLLVPRPGNDALLKRFEAERQLLARLGHAHIARLLDGGRTDDGWPYFVMELVDGMPIDQYCDDHRLDIDQRLALFLQVLNAVQYAHRNLVVHRDLKPSNILVTEAGEVKLLDFGIAKLLDGDQLDGQATELTRLGGRPMTPAWASPEQIEGDTITTASDVYSLGVLLYQLLAGQVPFSGDSPASIRQAVLTQTPVAPSRVPGNGLQIADRRSTRPDRLVRRLRGDLDTIVMMCLRKEPDQRYAAVGELIDDINRHLNNQPVRAHAATRRYRLGKFLRRYRIPVAVTAGIFALVGAGLAVIALQARELAIERDAATREALKSDQVSAFLLDLFTQGDAWQRDGDEPTVRDLIARGANSASALEATPEIQLHMLTALARASLSMGDYDQAIRLLEAAEDALQRTAAPQPDEWIKLLNQLGEAFNRAGRFEEAVARHRRALEFVGSEKSMARAQTLSNLGVPLRRLNRYEQSEQVQREALALIQRLEPGGRQEAMAQNNLAIVLAASDRNSEARVHFEAALALHREASGAEHPATLTAMGNLATFLSDNGDFDAAEPLMMETLALRTKVLGEDHPRVAHMMHALGLLHERRGNLDQAEHWWLQVLERRAATLGADHFSNGPTYHSLGTVAMRRGDLDEAERRFLRAQSIYQQAYGAEHRFLARVESALGQLARQRGDLDAAETRTRRALEMQQGLLGERHGEIAMTLRQLAEIARDRGDYPAARHLAAQSLDMLENVYENPAHPRTVGSRELLTSLQVDFEP